MSSYSSHCVAKNAPPHNVHTKSHYHSGLNEFFDEYEQLFDVPPHSRTDNNFINYIYRSGRRLIMRFVAHCRRRVFFIDSEKLCVVPFRFVG